MNSNKRQTYCLGGRHFCKFLIIIEYEKVNPTTKKLVKFIEGKCAICGRKKSQIFTK